MAYSIASFYSTVDTQAERGGRGQESGFYYMGGFRDVMLRPGEGNQKGVGELITCRHGLLPLSLTPDVKSSILYTLLIIMPFQSVSPSIPTFGQVLDCLSSSITMVCKGCYMYLISM